jgi:hypothetical protein
MPKYRKRSRVTKALTDAALVGSFGEAEARLDAIRLNVAVGSDQVGTPAGQAAILTAVATACKCFGRVTVVSAHDAPLIAPLPIGATVTQAARRLGAKIAERADRDVTHTVRIGDGAKTGGWTLRCWWDRWLSGIRAFDYDAIGDSRLPTAGVFAGAIAVRQVFACVLAGRNVQARDVSVSVWTPWDKVDPAVKGPERFDLPDKVWFLGLGHLGQAFVWNLCLLPGRGDRLAVLQDDQTIGEENEATSLLVLPGNRQMNKRKARIAAGWLEACGWSTALIERRHHGDISITMDDPPYLLSGLDQVEPRLVLARHGFPFMLDAGIGHGAGDFEGIQIRTIAKCQSIDGLWEEPKAETKRRSAKLLESEVYRELEKHVGQCGKFEFAEASVAVPFVGAVAGALVIGQLVRLATLQPSPMLLQMELASPEMATYSGLIPTPETNLGSFSASL